MSPNRPRYKVPTHLKLPDKVLFGLTARQLLILLIGASLAYNLWFQLDVLAAHGTPGQVLRIGMVALPVGLALAFALIELAGRPLEIWFWLVLRYCQQPRVCVWRSLRREDTSLPAHARGYAHTRNTADTSDSLRKETRS